MAATISFSAIQGRGQLKSFKNQLVPTCLARKGHKIAKTHFYDVTVTNLDCVIKASLSGGLG
jgi:hypothetical protein